MGGFGGKAVAGGVAVLCALALKYLPWPYVWICGVLAAACGYATWRSQPSWARTVWVNLGALFLALGSVEALSGVHAMRDERNALHFPPTYLHVDHELGAAPTKGMSIRMRRFYDSQLLYDVVYSIDEKGLRRSPPDRGTNLRGCALFFSDSFVFGEGVNDEETVPYRTGIHAGGDVRVYNLGFHGYGAHQMLAMLESSRIDSAIDCRPTHAVYMALTDHVARAAGLRSYVRHGPRYELVTDSAGTESVRRVGHFDDADSTRPAPFWVEELRAQALKSHYYRSIASRTKTATDNDIKRYVAIVVAAHQLIQHRYPGCEFHVLLWQRHDGPAADREFHQIQEALLKADIPVHVVDDILPGYRQDASPFEIPHDGHPNARADDLIARYVARTILGPRT